MTEKELFTLIKKKLENSGTKFSEYYGQTIIHSSGPRPVDFFEPLNEGNYTIHVLKIPEKFYSKKVNLSQVKKFLEEYK